MRTLRSKVFSVGTRTMKQFSSMTLTAVRTMMPGSVHCNIKNTSSRTQATVFDIHVAIQTQNRFGVSIFPSSNTYQWQTPSYDQHKPQLKIFVDHRLCFIDPPA